MILRVLRWRPRDSSPERDADSLPLAPLAEAASRAPRAAVLAPGALLALACVVQVGVLPAWCFPALGLAAATRALPKRLPRRFGVVVRLVLLAALVSFALHALGAVSAPTLRFALAAVLVLKWAELRASREIAPLLAGGLLLLAIGVLEHQTFAGFALAVSGVMLAMATSSALLKASSSVQTLRMSSEGSSLGGVLREAMVRVAVPALAALPLAALLFAFFPRVPGPLWDLGYTLGLPLSVFADRTEPGLGAAARLAPGRTRPAVAAGKADTPVLVAEFAGYVPPTSRLYWRGPVFYDFAEGAWQLEADWSNRARLMSEGFRSARQFDAQVREKREPIDYRVRVGANGAHWLYALDLPAKLAAESYLTREFQLLSMTPLREESAYSMSAWLDYAAGGALAPALRDRSLAFPTHDLPRLAALGARLRQENGGSTAAIVRAALTHLAQNGFQFGETIDPPTGADAYDRFWFETRHGNAELYAGALALLLRAAGVPTRVVTGYRGGKLMALTDYVVVKRSHAHAWLEAWDEARGWSRVDPSDVVAPERFAGDAAKATKPLPATPPAAAASAPPGPTAPTARPQPAPAPASADGDDPLAGFVARWIVHLDGWRQSELARRAGGVVGAADWIVLLVLLGGGIALLALARGVWLRWSDWRRVPRPERAFLAACAALARHELARAPGECVSRYAERVAALWPDMAAPVRNAASAWLDWRYGENADAAAVVHTSRILQRACR